MGVLYHDPQYHVVVREQLSGGAPGNEVFEITHEIKNLVWQRTLNLPGNAAFTLMRNSRVLAEFDWLKHHIEIYRQDQNSTEKVFRGLLVQPDYGPVDTVVLCWDYLAFLQRVRVDYYLNNARKRYSRKKLGFIVDDLWDRSIDTNSIIGWVDVGTIQNPRGDDDTTAIKTGNHFGIGGLQDLLTVYYDLAEMGMSNTDNTVVFEIDENNKFNFWRDVRADKDTISLTYPGTVFDYGYMEGWGNTVNDLATLVRNDNKPTSKKQITVQLSSGRGGISDVRKLQSAAQLGTFLGISKGTKNKGKKVLALRRMAKTQRRVDRLITVTPHQGIFTRFPTTFQLGHNLNVHLQKNDEAALDGYVKFLSVVGSWSAEGGEKIQMGFREKDVPD